MNGLYQKYDIYCKYHTKKKLSLKNVAKCEVFFDTIFSREKGGGGLSKMSADCQQGGSRKLLNLASADIWMTP